MREIKFRAYIKRSEVMATVTVIDFEHKEVILNVAESAEEYAFLGYRFDEVELMEFTGLLDKEGREIFEGDLIKKKFKDREIGEFYAVGRVVFGRWYAGFTVPYYYHGYNKLERLSSSFDKDGWIVANRDMEVIGNIHENPQLLEGEK